MKNLNKTKILFLLPFLAGCANNMCNVHLCSGFYSEKEFKGEITYCLSLDLIEKDEYQSANGKNVIEDQCIHSGFNEKFTYSFNLYWVNINTPTNKNYIEVNGLHLTRGGNTPKYSSKDGKITIEPNLVAVGTKSESGKIRLKMAEGVTSYGKVDTYLEGGWWNTELQFLIKLGVEQPK